MANLNKVMLMGNLTRDIELKYTPSGMAVARVGLAVNRRWRDTKTNELREEVTFVDIDAFGKQAETLHQYMTKGQALYIEGRLKLDSWDDKTTGKKQYKLKVICEQFQFLGGKGAVAPGGAPAQGGQAPMRSAPRPLPPRPAGGAGAGAGGAPVPAHDFANDQEPPPDDLDIPPDNIPF